MEREEPGVRAGGPAEKTADDMADFVVSDAGSFVKVDLDGENSNRCRPPKTEPAALVVTQDDEGNEDEDEDDDEDDSGTDHYSSDQPGTRLQRRERPSGNELGLPDTFQTGHLLFYERFKAYQDYILGDCKPSEVKAFTTDYLKKVVEPCDWLALWSTDIFDVLVEVCDVDFGDLKAIVKLVLPLQCQLRCCELTEEAMKALLEATQHKVPLQELHVAFDESGDFDQTALAIEHLRFFYQHVWRQWDEEDEDDDFDYFVRCVEPRLRLYYDILEDRVPAGLVAEYQSLLQNCANCFQQFSVLRSSLSSDSDLELDNVSMVEGLKLFDQLETYKRKLHIIENPLLRYVLGYKGNTHRQSVQSRGPRASGVMVFHVVTTSCSPLQLHSLLNDRLLPQTSTEETEVQTLNDLHVQFHRDPVSAVDSCHEGDTVIVLPGVYRISSCIFLADSITIEGFGLPDEIVVEKEGKGDSFVDSTGSNVKMSNIKFIQHDAIEGILCVRQGNLSMENCVLQCETTGVIVRTSAHLTMNLCDLYGSKGAGVEIYPGSICKLVGNGIHHCKDGILIKDFADEQDVRPSITLENNVIHNNEGYGVILVKLGSNPDATADRNPDHVKDEAPPPTAECQDTAIAPSPHIPEVPLPRALESSGGDDSTPNRKWQFCRQLSRNKEATCTKTVQDLTDHQVFESIQGNQFRRNGGGDYGTIFY